MFQFFDVFSLKFTNGSKDMSVTIKKEDCVPSNYTCDDVRKDVTEMLDPSANGFSIEFDKHNGCKYQMYIRVHHVF